MLFPHLVLAIGKQWAKLVQKPVSEQEVKQKGGKLIF